MRRCSIAGGAIFYINKSNERKAIEYRNETQSIIEQHADRDTIEVRGVQMSVKDAQGIIDYINLSY